MASPGAIADPRLSHPKSKEIELAFEEFDLNGDGALHPIEFQAALEALGVDVENGQVKSIIRKFENEELHVTFEDFQEIASELLNKVEPEHQVIKLFEVFDRDRTGKISLKNLKTVVQKLGEKMEDDQLESMIKLFDEDSDGELDISEFLGIFMKEKSGRAS